MKYNVCVIGGAGHVGLPLAIAFASRKKKVVIYDIDRRSLDTINKGAMPFMRKDQVLILRSTVFPGITDKVRRMLRRKLSGIEVAFCPERTIEGRTLEEIYALPQIVSSSDRRTVDKVSVVGVPPTRIRKKLKDE